MQGSVVALQALSGTGSLRIGAEFISKFMPGTKVYVSDPTWGNHHNIFADAGVKVEKYRRATPPPPSPIPTPPPTTISPSPGFNQGLKGMVQAQCRCVPLDPTIQYSDNSGISNRERLYQSELESGILVSHEAGRDSGLYTSVRTSESSVEPRVAILIRTPPTLWQVLRP